MMLKTTYEIDIVRANSSKIDEIDFENLAAWCTREGGTEAYNELLRELSKTQAP